MIKMTTMFKYSALVAMIGSATLAMIDPALAQPIGVTPEAAALNAAAGGSMPGGTLGGLIDRVREGTGKIVPENLAKERISNAQRIGADVWGTAIWGSAVA